MHLLLTVREGISHTFLGGVRRAAQTLPDPRSTGSCRVAGPGTRGPHIWLVRGFPLLGVSSFLPAGTRVTYGLPPGSLIHMAPRNYNLCYFQGNCTRWNNSHFISFLSVSSHSHFIFWQVLALELKFSTFTFCFYLYYVVGSADGVASTQYVFSAY